MADDITLYSAITWVLTTFIFGMLKKAKGYNPDYPIPFGSVTLGKFIGSIIAVVTGVIVVGFGNIMGTTTTDMPAVFREAGLVILYAVGFHGLVGTYISKKIEKVIIN